MANSKLPGKDFLGRLPEIKKLTSDFVDAVTNMERTAVTIAQQFGQGRENIVGIKTALAEASDSLTKVGVSVTDSVRVAAEIQKEYSSTIGRNALLTSESFGNIRAMTEVTGQSVRQITEGFANAGISILNSGEEMQKVVNASRAIGVDTGQVSKMVVENLGKTAQFNFQGGVEGMAKMAAQAVNLRIDMSKILDVADSLFDPEKAIDMAAAMQRLGVAQSSLLDPLRLMDLAQNDPAELQNQIAEMSKEFVRLNEKGQFEIMPGSKRQLMEISTQLGLGKDGLAKMALASAELDDKMSKIKLPDTFTDEQKSFIANMAQMGPGGEYKLKVDGEDVGLDKAIDLFTKDTDKFNKFMEASKPKSMEDLAREQIDVLTKLDRHLEFITGAGTRAGTAVGATQGAEELMKGALELTSKIPKIFGTEELSIKQMSKGADAGLKDLMGDLSKGEITEALQDRITGTLSFLEDAFRGASRRTEESLEEISKSKNEGVSAIRGVTGAALDKIEKYTGIKTGGQSILDNNRDISEVSSKLSMDRKENLDRIMSPETNMQQTTNKTELTYNGKLDININTPPGFTDTEWKTISTRLVNDPDFVQRIIEIANNPQGNKNPNQINQSINSVNPTR